MSSWAGLTQFLTSAPACAILFEALEQHTFLWQEWIWPERDKRYVEALPADRIAEAP